MAGQQVTNVLAALLVNRVPGWYVADILPRLANPPISGVDVGHELLNSPRTRVFASTKLVQDRRTGFILLGAGGADVTATYNVAFDGEGTSTFDALVGNASSASDIYNGIFDAMIAAGYTTLNVEKLLDGDGNTTGLMTYSTGSGDSGAPSTFTIDVFSATGAGELHVFGEPVSIELDFWVTAKRGANDGPPAPDHWVRLASWGVIGPEGVWGVVQTDPGATGYNADKMLDTAGAERIIPVIPSFVPVIGDDAGAEPAFYVHFGPATDDNATTPEST
jgi:hypothetical protein